MLKETASGAVLAIAMPTGPCGVFSQVFPLQRTFRRAGQWGHIQKIGNIQKFKPGSDDPAQRLKRHFKRFYYSS